MPDANKNEFLNLISSVELLRTISHLVAKRAETRPQSGISSRQRLLMFGLMSVIASECFGQISIGGFEIPSPPGVDLSLPDVNLPNVLGIELGHKPAKWTRVRHLGGCQSFKKSQLAAICLTTAAPRRPLMLVKKNIESQHSCRWLQKETIAKDRKKRLPAG